MGLEITTMRLVKVNQNRHYFTQAQPRGRPALASHAQQIGNLPCNQPLTEVIGTSEQIEYAILPAPFSVLENSCCRAATSLAWQGSHLLRN